MQTVSICIDVNNHCNLHCKYCYLGEKANTKEINLIQVFQQILQAIQKDNRSDRVYAIKLAAAEPLLSFDLIREAFDNCVALVTHPQVRWYLSTTMVLMTDEMLSFFHRYRFDFYTTIHGDKETHNLHRGEYDKTVQQIQKVSNTCREKIALNFIISQDMLGRDFYDSLIYWVRRPQIGAVIVSKISEEDWTQEEYSLYYDQMKKFIYNSRTKDFEKLRLVTEDNGRVIFVNLEGEFHIVDFTTEPFLAAPENFLVEYSNADLSSSPIDETARRLGREIQKWNKQIISFFNAEEFPATRYEEGIVRTYPANLIMNITDDCNLGCKYCFTTPNPRYISLDTMRAATAYMIHQQKLRGLHQKFSIAFFGGEPMMGFETLIRPFVDWLAETGLRTEYSIGLSMTTNGTLLTPDATAWLKNNAVNILLSIDGNRCTQDGQRPCKNGESSFDILEKNIPSILTHYPYVTFRSAITPEFAHQIGENYLFARKQGFKNYYLIPNVFETWDEASSEQLLIGIANICKTIYRDVTSFNLPCEFSEFSTALGLCFSQKHHFLPADPYRYFRRCGVGTTSIGVGVDGGLWGCQEHATYQEKDIFYIGDLWQGIDELRHRRLLGALTDLPHPVCKETKDRCENCSYKEHCKQHFCPSHNMQYGTLTENPLIHCKWKDIIYQMAKLCIVEAIKSDNQEFLNYARRKGDKSGCQAF